VWDELHPTREQQRELYDWLLANGEGVLTGDSFFHLSAFGEALPGLNLCGAGRVVCLIDPVGDVYACPFAIHENFLAGNVRDPGGFQRVWQGSDLFAELRSPQTGGACTKCAHFDACRGGCMAAKFFTGLPLDGPDPECVQGYGETALAAGDGATVAPRSHLDHSHTGPVRGRPTLLGMPGIPARSIPTPPSRACDESPLAGVDPRSGVR
jgi:radical SAM protein with 4Fe4S-binding SPASM domain